MNDSSRLTPPWVMDCGVVVKSLVTEHDSEKAFLLLQRQHRQEVRLLAPEFLLVEAANVIWKKQRFQGIDASDAQQMVDSLFTIPITLTPSVELLKLAYDLAVAHQRSVYDCLYLALSIHEQCPFITADEKLHNAVQPRLPNIVLLRDYT